MEHPFPKYFDTPDQHTAKSGKCNVILVEPGCNWTAVLQHFVQELNVLNCALYELNISEPVMWKDWCVFMRAKDTSESIMREDQKAGREVERIKTRKEQCL